MAVARESIDDLAARWLTFAREVVSDEAHRASCAIAGGSDPAFGFPPDVRWPGYLGADYQAGGVLWISNIHRNFDSAGLPRAFAATAADVIRCWRDGSDSDDQFLAAIRTTYERGPRQWTVGSWPGKALLSLDVDLRSVAYTNVAKCQAVDTGVALQKLCIGRWPIRRLVELLAPGLVLLTSETGLRLSGPSKWPCPVVAFSQRNGRLLNASPWKPPAVSTSVSFIDWMGPLLEAQGSPTK